MQPSAIQRRIAYDRAAMHHMSNAERFMAELITEDAPYGVLSTAEGFAVQPNFGSALGAVSRTDELLAGIIARAAVHGRK